jgi:hypothetical protein
MRNFTTLLAVARRGALAFGLLSAVSVAGAESPRSAPQAVDVSLGSSRIDWAARVPNDGLVLTVSGPGGFIFQKEFPSGRAASFEIYDQDRKVLPDGGYQWEIRLQRKAEPAPAVSMEGQESKDGRPAGAEASRSAPADPESLVQSGHFRILNGSIVPAGLVEPAPRHAPAPQATGAVTPGAGTSAQSGSVLRPASTEGTLAIQTAVEGDTSFNDSICVGFDCTNAESFGFDTIRLKENNLRIKFEDTSVSPFPTNDWQLTANDSASGGANRFSIDDVTNSRTPFTVTANAPTASIFVASSGRVGFRTSTPAVDLHTRTGNTPTLRLDQDGSSGFTPQVWDIAGNEAGFFIRDVTHGSALPFRVLPGAPSNFFNVTSAGIGIGTLAPAEKLHVFDTANANTFIEVENAGTGSSSAGVLRAKSDVATVNFQAHYSGRTISRFGQTLGGWAEFLQVSGNGLIIGTNPATPLILGTSATNRMFIDASGNIGLGGLTAPSNPLQHSNGARLTAGGVWTNASSRDYKTDICRLEASDARTALAGLDPVEFRYKVDPAEHHVGFIAEDVPALVATKDRKSLSPMDIVAVLTRVVQEQQRQIDELTSKVRELEASKR